MAYKHTSGQRQTVRFSVVLARGTMIRSLLTARTLDKTSFGWVISGGFQEVEEVTNPGFVIPAEPTVYGISGNWFSPDILTAKRYLTPWWAS